ncbi:MAG: hypothetical protein AB1585_07520 [Thermodesulfobacteriota bacterium]
MKAPFNRIPWAKVLAVLLLVLMPVPVGQAATIIVPCDINELIKAINTANENAGAETLELATDCTYTATAIDNTGDRGTNAFPQITSDITINGHNTTIQRSSNSGTPQFRFFEVRPSGKLTLNHLTFIKGMNDDFENNREKGGAIANFGILEVSNNIFTENRGGCGGAIFSEGDTAILTVTNSTFTNNPADG